MVLAAPELPDEQVERTMMLEAPDFGGGGEPKAAPGGTVLLSAGEAAVTPPDRTMLLEAPDFSEVDDAKPAAPGGTMLLSPGEAADAVENVDRTIVLPAGHLDDIVKDEPKSDPLERTMQYEEPGFIDEVEAFDPAAKTLLNAPPVDGNALTQPLTPLDGAPVVTPPPPPAGSTEATETLLDPHGQLDLNARTLPLQKPELGGDQVARTIQIQPPSFPPLQDDPGEVSQDELGLDLNAATIPIQSAELVPRPPQPPPDRGRKPGSDIDSLSDTVAEPQRDLTGQLLGNRYQVLAKIGQGGMGTVYKAEHTMMGRVVAVKVLNRELIRSEHSVARFKREIKTMAQFQHPNVVRLFDAGTTDSGHLYMAMEYVEGTGLDQLLARQQRLTLDRFATYFAQILLGVAMGHSRGIVHRDLKTENILLCTTQQGVEQIKIMDFGIAKLLGEGGGPQETKNLTIGRMAVGTPEYMSPEQASGDSNIDHRSDLYSLGVVAFELLTGRLPFDADSPVGYIGKHILEPPLTFEEALPGLGLPPAVEQFVQKALSKDPQGRYPSAEAMLDSLEEAVPAEIRTLVSQVRVRTLGTAQSTPNARAPLTHSQARKGATPTESQLVRQQAADHAAKQARVARALKLSILVCGLLLLVIGGLLVHRIMQPPDVGEALGGVDVQALIQAQEFDKATKQLTALLDQYDEETGKPITEELTRVKRARAAVTGYAEGVEAIQGARKRFHQARELERLQNAQDAFKELQQAIEDVASHKKTLAEFKLDSLTENTPSPQLDQLRTSLQVLERISTAQKLMENERSPDFRSAINQLKEAKGLVPKESPEAERLDKLLAEARAREKIRQAERQLEAGQLEAALASHRQARKMVRQHVLSQKLHDRLDEIEREIQSKRNTNDRKAQETKVQSRLSEAQVLLEKKSYDDALKQLKEARDIAQRAGLPDNWNLDQRLARTRELIRSKTAYGQLPKAAPRDQLSVKQLRDALSARERYVKNHPKGHEHMAVRAQIGELKTELNNRRGDANLQAVRELEAKAKKALEAGNTQDAESFARQAKAKAKALGLTSSAADALLTKVKQLKSTKSRSKALKDFVRVGDLWVSRFEVTNLDYWQFCLLYGRSLKEGERDAKVRPLLPKHREWTFGRRSWLKKFERGQGQRPVSGISYQNAEAYCAWQSKKLGLTVRLPTRAEWIAAASEGSKKQRKYPWGDRWDPTRVVFQRPKTEFNGKLGQRWLRGATPNKIMHMAGNVAEWTRTVWVDPETGKDKSSRVLMGGHYRSLRRESLEIDYPGERGGVTERRETWGFRVVIEAE